MIIKYEYSFHGITIKYHKTLIPIYKILIEDPSAVSLNQLRYMDCSHWSFDRLSFIAGTNCHAVTKRALVHATLRHRKTAQVGAQTYGQHYRT